jgi:hypothetical protein
MKKLAAVVSIFISFGLIVPTAANAVDDPCLSSVAIIGTPGDDLITGTPGDDIICTLAGNDTIESLAGDDIILAGDGDDRVISVEGNDYVEGGDGNDFVDSGAGDDQIQGNVGDDILWGGLGVDELLGLAGNDTLDGGSGADLIDGGLDRNYCVKDSKDKKALSCFYDSKAPRLTAFSVAPESRIIDTSNTAKWVRVKALVSEAGSGLVEAGFSFVNWKSTAFRSFGASGSLASPDRAPTNCDSLTEISKTPPPNTLNPKSFWCVEKSSASGAVVEFLIAAPYRLPKGDYSFSGITLTDGALNNSSQNGANFNVKVRQTADVPSGEPVLKSFEFISSNKVNTATASQKVLAEAVFATGPVGLGPVQITFHRDIDRSKGENGIYLLHNLGSETKYCDPKVEKNALKETCILSEAATVTKIIFAANVPKNSPAGTYRFSFLGISSKSGKGTEITYENLKKDTRYEQFTKLAIVQSAASTPIKIDGRVELRGIQATQKTIDTGTGAATIDVMIDVSKEGSAVNWYVEGSVVAMFCPSGSIRKFNSITMGKDSGFDSIQAGEYCSSLQSNNQGKKVWWPDTMAANTISSGGNFTIPPGSPLASTTLTIPANFRKGTIIVGLGSMSVNLGEQQYASVRGNWVAMTLHAGKNKYPSALSCGQYASCTKYYSVVKNGK